MYFTSAYVQLRIPMPIGATHTVPGAFKLALSSGKTRERWLLSLCLGVGHGTSFRGLRRREVPRSQGGATRAFGSGTCPYAGDECVVDGRESSCSPSSAVLPASESHMSSQLSCTVQSVALTFGTSTGTSMHSLTLGCGPTLNSQTASPSPSLGTAKKSSSSSAEGGGAQFGSSVSGSTSGSGAATGGAGAACSFFRVRCAEAWWITGFCSFFSFLAALAFFSFVLGQSSSHESTTPIMTAESH
mmetsp:Transcript_53215/g.127261  ORF Transcript_53215/g.127261 Transcript_53215/m.127261 type:complete len:244 (-) Transcript_53215:19-750(-)